MRRHTDLTGLIKYLARDDWRLRLEEVLAEHFGPAVKAFDLDGVEIGDVLGDHFRMTLWGCAFEDFLTRRFEPEDRNFVDDYLARRGWNESAPAKAYMRALRVAIMSLYEVSAITPGTSFLARDLIRGGEPVLVSERSATQTLKDWDRIAARVVLQGQKGILAGGLLAFSTEASESVMTELRRAAAKSGRPGRRARSLKNLAITDDELREAAPLFTAAWLLDELPRVLGLSQPTFANSEGDEVVFHNVRFPIASTATLPRVVRRLTALAGLQRENDRFWNWLDAPAPLSVAGGHAKNALAWHVTMEGGVTVLGNIEIRERALILSVNSATRAMRGTTMLREALGDLVDTPLTEIQTIEQMIAEQTDNPAPASDIPAEVQTKLVHALLDKQYRTILDQPVGMLGDVTPRAAVRTAAGRHKVVGWLKYLENRSLHRPDPNDPMATYDFTWLWRELKVEDLRQ